MLGHSKTIAVLLASWWVFHEPMIPRKLLGMALAVAGMTAYGHSMAQNLTRGGSKPKTEEAEPDVRATVVVPAQEPKHSSKGPSAHPIRVSESSREGGSGGGGGSGDGEPPAGLRARRGVAG